MTQQIQDTSTKLKRIYGKQNYQISHEQKMSWFHISFYWVTIGTRKNCRIHRNGNQCIALVPATNILLPGTDSFAVTKCRRLMSAITSKMFLRHQPKFSKCLKCLVNRERQKLANIYDAQIAQVNTSDNMLRDISGGGNINNDFTKKNWRCR